MNKQEFLEQLRISLNGKVPGNVVAENISFYEDYINTELRKGKSEEEILGTLGDPRLIARTIVETASKGTQSGYGEEANRASGDGQGEETAPRVVNGVPGWVWLVIFAIVILVLLAIVFRILLFAAPIILVVGLVLYVIKFFSK